MGWFDTIRSYGKKALTFGGNALKKVGSIGGKVLRHLGDWAPTIGAVGGTILDGIAIALAQPELIAAGESARLAGNMIGDYSKTFQPHAERVGSFGQNLVDYGEGLG